MHKTLFWLVKAVNNAIFWLVSINNGFLKKERKTTRFEPNRVLWYSGKVFFTSNFLISGWISIKTVANSQQKRFQQLTKYFCVTLIVLIWRMLWQEGVIFVTFPQPCRTPKPDMVKISLFAQIFQLLCLRKRINFTSTLYQDRLDYMNH